MDGKLTLGMLLLVLGVVILIISVLADPIGLGNYTGFGRNQIIGVLVGAIVLLLGVLRHRGKQSG